MQEENLNSPAKINHISPHLLAPTESQKHGKWVPKPKSEEKKWNLTLSASIPSSPEPNNVPIPKSLQVIHSRLHDPTVASLNGSFDHTAIDNNSTEVKTTAFGSTFKSSNGSAIKQAYKNSSNDATPERTKESLIPRKQNSNSKPSIQANEIKTPSKVS